MRHLPLIIYFGATFAVATFTVGSATFTVDLRHLPATLRHLPLIATYHVDCDISRCNNFNLHDKSLTFSLLNTRSLRKHAGDIANEARLMTSDIIWKHNLVSIDNPADIEHILDDFHIYFQTNQQKVLQLVCGITLYWISMKSFLAFLCVMSQNHVLLTILFYSSFAIP